MNNMKLSVKLIGSFLIVALLITIVGISGSIGIRNTEQALNHGSNVLLPSINSLNVINEAQTAIKLAERSLLIPEYLKEDKDVDLQMKNMEKAWKRVEHAWKIYEPLEQTKEEAAVWGNFKTAWDAWKGDISRFGDLAKAKKRDEAVAFSSGKLRESFDKAEKLLGDLIDINVKGAKEEARPRPVRQSSAPFWPLDLTLWGPYSQSFWVFFSPCPLPAPSPGWLPVLRTAPSRYRRRRARSLRRASRWRRGRRSKRRHWRKPLRHWRRCRR